MELDEEHTKCSICVTEFSFDRDNKDPEIRKHLPVLSSSQRCDHWFCHGCILREQLRVAEENNGRIPKWLKCMHCREKTSFNPAEPKYHRLLIDLLARAQAARVKSKSKMEEGTSKSDDDDGAKKTTTKEGMGRVAAAASTKRKDEENIVTQWIKCVNDMSTAQGIQFLGEYVLHKCVAMWHDKIFNRSFRFDSDFVLGFDNSRIIWLELLSDLRSFIEQYGRRYAASMLRRTVFKNLRSVQDRSQPISKLALEWAVGAVNDLLEKGVGSRWHGQTVLSFCTKHNQFKYIDDNMQTNRGIQDAHNRLMMFIRRRSTEKQNVSGETSVA